MYGSPKMFTETTFIVAAKWNKTPLRFMRVNLMCARVSEFAHSIRVTYAHFTLLLNVYCCLMLLPFVPYPSE